MSLARTANNVSSNVAAGQPAAPTTHNYALTLRRLHRLALTGHATPAPFAGCGGSLRLRGTS
jgi:hypothetical protein